MTIHYKGIMVIIPSIVTAIFLGAFWRRFNSAAAIASMLFGSTITVLSVWYPEWITPISKFVVGPENQKFIYMRALFGMLVTAVIGITVTFMTKKDPERKSDGLTASTLDHAMKLYKGGGTPNHTVGEKARFIEPIIDNSIEANKLQMNSKLMELLKAEEGDIVYMEDSRWYLGGLRSHHVKATKNDSLKDNQVALSEETHKVAYLVDGNPLHLEKIF